MWLFARGCRLPLRRARGLMQMIRAEAGRQPRRKFDAYRDQLLNASPQTRDGVCVGNAGLKSEGPSESTFAAPPNPGRSFFDDDKSRKSIYGGSIRSSAEREGSTQRGRQPCLHRLEPAHAWVRSSGAAILCLGDALNAGFIYLEVKLPGATPTRRKYRRAA
jgi:hypothetical protein